MNQPIPQPLARQIDTAKHRLHRSIGQHVRHAKAAIAAHAARLRAALNAKETA